MTNPTADRWRQARNLVDLGELSAAYFLGFTDFHPEQMLGDQVPDVDPTIALTIADLNHAGLVTVDYLPGTSTGDSPTEQRAAVQGFCDSITLEWLTAGLYGTRFQALAVSSAIGGFGAALDLNAGVPVRRINTRTTHRFGRQLTHVQIRETLFGGLLNREAANVLTTSWNLTVFDPVWNSAELWPTLARIADPEPMLLARERRQSLPAA